MCQGKDAWSLLSFSLWNSTLSEKKNNYSFVTVKYSRSFVRTTLTSSVKMILLVAWFLITMHANAENILNTLFALGAEAIKYSDFIFEILFPCFLSVPPLATEQVNVLCFNLSKLNDITWDLTLFWGFKSTPQKNCFPYCCSDTSSRHEKWKYENEQVLENSVDGQCCRTNCL